MSSTALIIAFSPIDTYLAPLQWHSLSYYCFILQVYLHVAPKVHSGKQQYSQLTKFPAWKVIFLWPSASPAQLLQQIASSPI